ncbi:MAG TPA: hypothetical protein VKT78_15085 [Fimbriimonadaceae bacterium]|nr:hypothetical protein [Fimbriimonadaceae bacterium]
MHLLLSAALLFGQATTPANSYLQTVTEPNGVFSLKTAARRLHAEGKPDVWLVGVAHVGLKSYYASIQKLLDAQSQVLYEGVKQSPNPAEPPTANKDAKPAGPAPKPVYQVFSDALGLDFQLVDINYNHPNWVDSDLTMEELDALNKGGAGGKPNTFDTLKNLLDPSSPMAAQFARILAAMTPGTKEGLKLFMVKRLSALDPFAVIGDPTTTNVVLTARNKSAERFFDKAINKPEHPASVAIFYGALHQPDLEADLAKQYGYKVVETRWFKAATADTKKVDAQGQTVYNLLDAQLSPKAPKQKP